MALDTRINKQGRRTPFGLRRTVSVRPIAWLRDYPGAQTAPSQQAIDAVSNTIDFPRH